MGSYIVFIVFSLFILNYISAKTFIQPTDETDLEIIKNADEDEGIPDPYNVKCPPVENPLHGHTIGNISRDVGSIVQLRCDPGYAMMGEQQIECQAIPNPFDHRAEWFHKLDGTYSTSKPICYRVIWRKPTSFPDSIKDSRRDLNQFIDAPINENIGDNLVDEETPPPPLTSQGRPKSSSDDRVHFPLENENESEHTEEETEVSEQKTEEVDKNIRNDCSLPYEVGTCRASKPRFYYDVKTKTCKKFIYGGCGGNKNNFMTKKECENVCVQTFSSFTT